jgi:hemerythrin
LRTDPDADHLVKLLKQLEDYAYIHFTGEERHMSRFRFEGYEAHKREHDAFVAYIDGKIQDVKQGKGILSLGVTDYLKTWIRDHVLGTDSLYSDIFNKNGLK